MERRVYGNDFLIFQHGLLFNIQATILKKMLKHFVISYHLIFKGYILNIRMTFLLQTYVTHDSLGYLRAIGF